MSQEKSQLWERTNALRWRVTLGLREVLQQAWVCKETGGIEWRDVPHEH